MPAAAGVEPTHRTSQPGSLHCGSARVLAHWATEAGHCEMSIESFLLCNLAKLSGCLHALLRSMSLYEVRHSHSAWQIVVWQMSKDRGDAGNDGFTERGVNTFNDLPKHKNMQTDRIQHRDTSTFASSWELYDTYSTVPGKIWPPAVPHRGFCTRCIRSVQSSVYNTLSVCIICRLFLLWKIWIFPNIWNMINNI